jgi:biopolymer transport protein ExbD
MHVETTSSSTRRERKVQFGSLRRRRRKGMAAALNLTPMVDMFSLLVIFLLQFFSTSPEFLLMPGVTLPTSATVLEPKRAPVLAITESEVFVEKKLIGKITDILRDPDSMIKELNAVAKFLAEKGADPDTEGGGRRVSIEAHEAIKSTVISNFMAILSAYHYGDIELVALSART